MSSPGIDVILCPDCGGVVGATEITEAGPPCRCFADAPKPKPKPVAPIEPIAIESKPNEPAPGGVVNSVTTSDESDSNGVSEQEENGAGSSTEKLCVVCGKNVSGHRRLKDSRGYICLDCAKKEQFEKKPQGVKCPKCFRVVKPETLGKFDGSLMCQRCLREAREVTKPGSKRFRKIDDKHFEEHSKTQLYVLVGVAVVLAIIIVVGLLRG